MSITNVSRRSAIKLGAGAMALVAGATMMTSSTGAARADEAGEAVFSAPGTYTAAFLKRRAVNSAFHR